MGARPIRRQLIGVGELQACKLIVVRSYDLDADWQALIAEANVEDDPTRMRVRTASNETGVRSR
jgi:hypothetical protein